MSGLDDSFRAGLPCAACRLAALGAMLLVVTVGSADDPRAAVGTQPEAAKHPGLSAPESRPGLATFPTRVPVSQLLGASAKTQPRFSGLLALHFVNMNTHLALDLRLYDDVGAVDEQAAAGIDMLLGDTTDAKHPRFARLDRRTLQLVYRAAYHFKAPTVEVLSAYRAAQTQNASGPHALGRALDFNLPGVPAATLAAYLRKIPRAGVGVYTHRRTQYVHLDTREVSYHWLDASPPGRRWRELSIGPRSMTEHDGRYRREEDWPEGFAPPG